MNTKRMLAIELDINKVAMNKEAVESFLRSVAKVASDSIISNKDCEAGKRTFHNVGGVAVRVTLDAKPMSTYSLSISEQEYTVKATSMQEAIALFKNKKLMISYYICEEGGLPFFVDEFNLADFIKEEASHDMERSASEAVTSGSVSLHEFRITVGGGENKFNVKADSYQKALVEFKNYEPILEYSITTEDDIVSGDFNLAFMLLRRK